MPAYNAAEMNMVIEHTEKLSAEERMDFGMTVLITSCGLCVLMCVIAGISMWWRPQLASR
jgi:cytochrome b subunit of formate dehydrogenase